MMNEGEHEKQLRIISCLHITKNELIELKQKRYNNAKNKILDSCNKMVINGSLFTTFCTNNIYWDENMMDDINEIGLYDIFEHKHKSLVVIKLK